jgi:hypothetical protein
MKESFAKVKEFVERRVCFRPSLRYGIGSLYRQSLGYYTAVLDHIAGRNPHNPFGKWSDDSVAYDIAITEIALVKRLSECDSDMEINRLRREAGAAQRWPNWSAR